MYLSQCVLSTVLLSTGVSAFYPYHFGTSSSGVSAINKLKSRFFAYTIGIGSEDGEGKTGTLSLKKVSKRDNRYSVVMGDTPNTPSSMAIDEDGRDYSYFSVVNFGSKNEEMWMLLDTGGTNTWVFGSDCTEAACLQHNTFGSNDSTTLKTTSTPFSVGYGTGTVEGVLASDAVSFAGFNLQVTFGLASNASSDFLNYPMDGILGLGRSSSSIGTPTVMDVMTENKSLKSNIIGISLQRNSDGAKDGEITFGGVDNSKFTGDIVYTNTLPNNDRWEVPVQDASVDGKACNLTGKSAIIDTGTSFILLPPADASAIHALIPGASPLEGENFNVPCKSTAEVQFIFSGVTYGVSPKDYVGSPVDSSGTTCVSNIIGLQTFGPDDWLLGDVFLKNVYTVFDYDSNRIGFAGRPGSAAPSNTAAVSATATGAVTVTGNETAAPASQSGTSSSTTASAAPTHPFAAAATTAGIHSGVAIVALASALCLSLVTF
jgi:cathepsin D